MIECAINYRGAKAFAYGNTNEEAIQNLQRFIDSIERVEVREEKLRRLSEKCSACGFSFAGTRNHAGCRPR